jgi:aryl-alcohol dehydrogenase-like predicted oxidoreductase
VTAGCSRVLPGLDRPIAPIALGGWLTLGDRLDEQSSLRLLHRAVDGGIDFVDVADVYAGGQAERVVGRFLREVGRDRVVVASKVFWPTSERPEDRGLSRRHVHAAIDRTLQRLGCERIDVYFCHREDPDTPLAETVRAMGDLVLAGKVGAWGTSCWRPATLRRAHALARELGVSGPAVEQPQYNLLERSIETDVLPACASLGMAVVAFSPLAGGVLTGKYLGGQPKGSRGATTAWLAPYRTERCNRVVARFVAGCAARSLPPAATALAWVASRRGLTAAICGAMSEEQLDQNLVALQLLRERVDLEWVAATAPAPALERLRAMVRALRRTFLRTRTD